MIDRYILMTTLKSVKRQWAARGAAAALEIPDELIEFFPGHDAIDYNNSLAQVAEAAADDGYPFLWQFAVGMESAWIKQSAGNVALFWNWLRLLRYIIEEGLTAVVLWDDRLLNVPFYTLEDCVEQLHERGLFYLWQLRIRGNAETMKALKRPVYEYSNPESHAQVFSMAKRIYFHDVADHYLQKDLIGYDESMVLTPEGAEWFYNEIISMPVYELSRDFAFVEKREDLLSEVEQNWVQRSRLTNDNYLCWDEQLHRNVQSAVHDDGLGIYTSKFVGYDFAKDYLPMGSIVNWATDPEHVDILESQPKPIKIRFSEV